MRRIMNRRLLAACVSALVLFLGPGPDDLSWQDGFSAVPQAHAARGGRDGRGGSGGHDSGNSHDHDTDSHDHDTDSHDHDADSGHEPGGGKGKGGPAYRGGRTGTSKGKGGPSYAVVEKIFNSE